VRPDFDGLRVHPCMGGEVGKFTVTRKCRGAEYRINVKNSGKGGAPKLTVDGQAISGDLVPYAKAGATVIVDCEV
jgi:cellobiose phosphorylase